MIDEEQIKGFFQKNYGKALNEYQIAVIKAIMENAQEPDKAHCIRVGASAGSGKTTLILFAFLTLVKFCGVNPHEIVILTLNTRVAQEINRKLDEMLRQIKITSKKPRRHAYTFHSFAMVYMKKYDMEIDKILLEGSSCYSKNLGYKIQNLLDKNFLSDESFRQDMSDVDFLIPEISNSREIESDAENRDLKKKLEELSIELNGDTLRGDLNKRICENFLRKHTLRGELLLDIQNKKELDYTFYKRISDVANRLFLMGILYDFKLYPDRALISFSNDEYGDSDEKIRHIEIVNGNQEDKIYDDSLLINSDYLKKLSEPLLPENWERITEEVSANEFPGLVPYYNYGAYDDGQETLENCNEGFVYRPTDEVTEFIMEIIERLRNEDIIIGTEKQQKFVNKLNKIVKLESDKGIVAFFRILRKIFPAIISEQYTTFSKILELAVRNSEPIYKDRLKSVKFVFIDEAQDLNNIFVDLLKGIKKYTQNADFIFVGDPAQSINRFIGANSSIFLSIEDENKLNMKNIQRFELPLTYRMDGNLVDIANNFKNNKTTKKSLNGDRLSSSFAERNRALLDLKMQALPDRIGKGLIEEHKISSENTVDICDAFFEELHKIISKELEIVPDRTFVLLARKNVLDPGGDLVSIRQRILHDLNAQQSTHRLDPKQIKISTIHRFKGGEADCAIILDGSAINYPYITNKKVRRIRELLFRDKEYYDYIDSINLFYVAITRAKYSLHIIYVDKPSKYLYRAGILEGEDLCESEETKTDTDTIICGNDESDNQVKLPSDSSELATGDEFKSNDSIADDSAWDY